MNNNSKLEKFAEFLDEDGRLPFDQTKPGIVGFVIGVAALCGFVFGITDIFALFTR